MAKFCYRICIFLCVFYALVFPFSYSYLNSFGLDVEKKMAKILSKHFITFNGQVTVLFGLVLFQYIKKIYQIHLSVMILPQAFSFDLTSLQ